MLSGVVNLFKNKIAIYMVLSLTLFSAHAEQQDQGVAIYMDQDLFVPFSNEDRDYTMGLAFEFFWEKEKGLYPFDNLIKNAGKWLGISDKENDIVDSFMLGTLAYTPDDLSDSQPIFNDRPYASLIYLSNKRVRADAETALAAEFMIGVIGTGFAREVQTEFHAWYRSLDDSDEPVEPQGWDHQISDGGELTMRLRLTNSRLHKKLSSQGTFDVSSTIGLSLGFQTNASAGVAMRLGKLKSPFWSLPFDPVNRGNFVPSRAKNEWYFWSAMRAHVVAYDALLQGQFRDSDVEYAADEIERLVYDGGAGFTWGFEKSQLTISANAKSADLKVMSRKQIWGGVHYIYHF